MEHYDYLLVGAGLYNAVLAHQIQKAGRSCLCVEKKDRVGGSFCCAVDQHKEQIVRTAERFKLKKTDTFDQLIERLFGNCEIRLSVDFLQQRERYQNIADEIIYTGSIDEYYDFCFGKLEYRSPNQETEPCCPVEDEKNRELYQAYRTLSEKECGVRFAGRFGEYRCFGLEEIIEHALSAAEELPHENWK